jgi:hypothetical protein
VEFVDLTAGEREAFVGASARAIALAHEGVRPELYDLARS